ncbi:MAG: hypothetical protein PVF45_06290 [Anaerolineae bacterium]|jgi:hypothetical protein
MSTPHAPLLEQQQATLAALKEIDESTLLQLTRLTLPEIRALRQEIAQVLPVGNLPAFVLGGLVKLKGRTVNEKQVKRDLTTLFQGITIVSQGLYSAFVVGPATVLHGYQRILQLAGKDTQAAFPEGTWQFYLQFGLREDAARHANETVAFPAQAKPVDAAAAWIQAIATFILDYDDLLATDWTERVSLRLLTELDVEAKQDIVRDWNTQRPYARPTAPVPGHAPETDVYLRYRRALFQAFLDKRLASLPEPVQKEFRKRFQARRAAELRAYQDQMTLLATLKPERYQEQREPIPIWRAQIGLIWQGRTYLIPLCHYDAEGHPLCDPAQPGDPIPLHLAEDDTLTDPHGQPVIVNRGGWVWRKGEKDPLGRLRLLPPERLKGGLAKVLKGRFKIGRRKDKTSLDLLLAASPRAEQEHVRQALPPATQAEITRLRRAAVILNWDLRPADAPLPYVRQGQRGIGDHALTIFRTERGFVFDQSHIFFDGLWGMAVAELLTNEAIYRHAQITGVKPQAPRKAPSPLKLEPSDEALQLAQEVCFVGEVAAEDDGIDMQRLGRLRRRLAQRGIRLTVNDLLLLYRFLYAGEYALSPQAQQAIETFRAANPDAKAAVQAIDECLTQMKVTNPALLIPMDASNVAPRERVFPTTFRNPLVEIGAEIAAADRARQAYREGPDPATWATFDKARREMLAYLNAFNQVLDALKAVTMRGESFNTASIRMLAHLPASMQNLLDQVPQRIGVLNEIIKGTEVFSNVGRVAQGSSLSRFCSARDDGATKWLIWGVLSDDAGMLHLSLRDFRPFVPLLLKTPTGRELADSLAHDFLHGYVKGFNRFVARLGAIVSEQKP